MIRAGGKAGAAAKPTTASKEEGAPKGDKKPNGGAYAEIAEPRYQNARVPGSQAPIRKENPYESILQDQGQPRSQPSLRLEPTYDLASADLRASASSAASAGPRKQSLQLSPTYDLASTNAGDDA